MKVAIIGDTHFGVRGGDRHFLDFQKLWFDEILFPYLKENEIPLVIQTGDFFDNRQYIKLNIIHEMLEWFVPQVEEHDLKWCSIVGNHDCFYRDSNEIHAQELLQSMSTRFLVADESVCDILSSEGGIALVPWINKNNQEKILRELDNSKSKYAVGHFELNGFPMYKGVLSTHGMETGFLDKFKLAISGHYHTVSEHKNIKYVGTPYHLTWSDVIDGNNRGFWVLDTETGEMEFIRNPDWATLFSVIEYDPEESYSEAYFQPYNGNIAKIVINEVKDEKHRKKFLTLVSQAGFLDYKTIDNTSIQVKSVEVKIDEKSNVKGLLENIGEWIDAQEVDVSKQNVKELANTVYLDVLNG